MSERSKVKLLSFGEFLSTTIVNEVLKINNVDSEFLNARKFMITSGSLICAVPEIEILKKKAPIFIEPVLKKGKVVLTLGFIGSNMNGATSVFSRGGSDYSAALIGMSMNAEEIEIWTDVDGILTADPKIISNPHSLKEISFEEASELAFFGSKILHPSAIIPVVEGKYL